MNSLLYNKENALFKESVANRWPCTRLGIHEVALSAAKRFVTTGMVWFFIFLFFFLMSVVRLIFVGNRTNASDVASWFLQGSSTQLELGKVEVHVLNVTVFVSGEVRWGGGGGSGVCTVMLPMCVQWRQKSLLVVIRCPGPTPMSPLPPFPFPTEAPPC